jgi:hypothetical protein
MLDTETEKKLHIIYASEGGNAWDVADNVLSLATKKKYPCSTI